MKCRRVEILVAAVVLFVCGSPVMAVIEFKDGLTHNIDYYINDDVWVDYESPGLGTTLNILDGASIYNFNRPLKGWEDSIINILGGWVDWLFAHDSSQVTVSGGMMFLLFAHDSSQVTVSGGSIDLIRAYGSSQVAVSGGSINTFLLALGSNQVTVSGGSIDGLRAYSSSRVTVSGGSMKALNPYGSSQVTVSGGSIKYLWASVSSQVTVSGGLINDEFYASRSSQVTVSGGSIGGEMGIWDDAVLTLHGWDFAVDGMPVGYTELYSKFGGSFNDEPYRQLTGTLLSGDPINNQFRIGNSGKIVLVPEPATLLLLGLGGVGLLRKRR